MQEQIDYILDSFDFETVKKTMDTLQWLWYDTVGVPEIYDLRVHARRLLKEVCEQVMKSNEFPAEANRATGGFRAVAHKYPDSNKIYLKLSFEVSTFDNYD